MAQRILGLMLMIFSLTMLPPIGVSFIYSDGHWQPFLMSSAIVAAAGLLLWLPSRNARRELRLRDGFLIVVVFWVFLGLAGATPLFLSDVPELSFTDAVFEAVSGFTTTGATVIVGLDELPKSILYYRQQIEWLGGMGIIVHAVAILPILGIGGMSLYKAETPGPMKDQKLTPRITQTAKALWAIYVSLTTACVAAYWLAGMNLFDAVAYAFSTVSTGGFSPYDASLAHFDSMAIEAVATVFMFLGGASFALHFTVLMRREPGLYWRDTEFKTYFLMTAVVTVFATIYLRAMSEFPTLFESFRHAIFQVVSMQTTTGLLTEGFAHWPGALPTLLILLSFIGGCAGSTTGGMKVIRWLVVFRQGVAELKQLVHPNAEVPVKLAGRPVPQRIILGVGGFFAMYLIVFAVLMLLLMMF
ncbi:MAG: potassium transporter TrkG, partial [Dongiaceae bacterium]